MGNDAAGIVTGIETGVVTTVQLENEMALRHEELDVYQLSITYVGWVYKKAETLNGIHRPARDQWLRASQSMPLNIAEGNGKTAEADRRRYFEIARGSALECAAIQDVLVVGMALDDKESREHKIELDRIVAMLSRLGGRGYSVEKSSVKRTYGEADRGSDGDFGSGSDPDPGSDPDHDSHGFALRGGTTHN